MDKNQIRTKKDDAKYAKVWALSERYEQVTHSRAPLDSTAIYPTNRSPNYTMRPVRRKPYQDHTFALRIFHLRLMMTILSTSRWNAFLDCSWLLKSCELLPHTPLWGNLSLGISSHIHDHTKNAKLKHMISSRCSSWTCALTWSTSNHFFFLHRDDVLKLTMNAHTIFFKTCFQ